MKKMKLAVYAAAIAMLSACGGGGDGELDSTINVAPIANAGANQTVTSGAVATLDGSNSSDANKDDLTYKWTITSKPTDSAPLFTETTTAKPTLTRTKVGKYEFTLVVNDGQLDSAPSTVTVTVDMPPEVGPIAARAPTAAEVEELTKIAVENIPLWVKSPSTFKVIGTPSWSYYDTLGKPDKGAITVNFDSQNGFGATVRTRAICDAEWDVRGYWRNTLSSSLALCAFF